MRAYSMDLRQRVAAACAAGDATRGQIADRFSVGIRWVRDLLRRRRQTGSIAPSPHGGGRPPAFDDEAAARLRGAVRADDDATLEELGRAAGVACSVPAVYRALDRMGITRQKKSRRAAAQDRPDVKRQRAEWRGRTAAVDPTRLAFLDETGTATAMGRSYGRAPGGARVDGPVPHGHWKTLTLTAAVRLGGASEAACLAFDGATDTACFEAYVERCLVPTLRPGDIAVMGNLACHKTADVERLIRSAGAEVWYLPPYSPDMNPIEQPFSKLKEAPRTAAARTVEALIVAMGEALRAVTPADILGWFGHSGYLPTASTGRVEGKPI